MKSMEDLVTKINLALSVKLKLCLITRGLPGRGKSRLARHIEEQIRENGVCIAAADDFLLDNQGNYCWRAEWLSIAHSSCVDKLTAAMNDTNISVVVQHNTNCKAWESEQLREQAEKMDYVVVYIEPEYAWSLQENLPMELQHALTSIHSVPAEKIPEMLLNKEEIVPRYVGYWIPTSYLLECFEQAGMAQTDVIEFLLSCHPKQTASKSIDQSSITPLLPTMLHVTTDYLGFDTTILSSENHETLMKDQLSFCQLSIVALYADERGVGAYVTGPGGVTTWIEPDVDDDDASLPSPSPTGSTLIVGSPRSTGSYLNSGSGKEDTAIESLHAAGGSGSGSGGVDGDKKRPKKRPKENKLVDPVPRFQVYTKALREAAGRRIHTLLFNHGSIECNPLTIAVLLHTISYCLNKHFETFAEIVRCLC